MKIKATRGVCIGVDKHIMAGETAEVETSLGQFLVSIGHEQVIELPVVAEPLQAQEEKKEPDSKKKK